MDVSKEYVKYQLKSLGMKDLSEEDLEAYTRDFSQLIQEHLQQETSARSPVYKPQTTGATLQYPRSTSSSRSGTPADSAMGHTPQTSFPMQPGSVSAVYKTFPGDGENRVWYLPPSATPSPVHPPSGHSGPTPARDTKLLSSRGDGDSGRRQVGMSETRRPPKRKVLRRINGEACVFDESVSDYGSESGSPGAIAVARQLSDLSITSITSSDISTDRIPRNGPRSPSQGRQVPTCRSQCKSFIRPSTAHPHSRGIKKCDPVARYHEFRQLWESNKAPGEKNRNGLRWHIREQLMHQDVPLYEPPRRTHKPNDFVVPTEKKRLALRWEVRHQMAHQ